jgi:hypothetical protein
MNRLRYLFRYKDHQIRLISHETVADRQSAKGVRACECNAVSTKPFTSRNNVKDCKVLPQRFSTLNRDGGEVNGCKVNRLMAFMAMNTSPSIKFFVVSQTGRLPW